MKAHLTPTAPHLRHRLALLVFSLATAIPGASASATAIAPDAPTNATAPATTNASANAVASTGDQPPTTVPDAPARIDWPLPTPPAGVNTATFPAPNNPWMLKFLANRERAAKGDVDLLFIGDSISEGWKNTGAAVFAASFPKDRTATFGISGDRTENMLWRLRHGEMDGIAPKVIVILAGTNNVNRNTVEEIAEGIETLVDECRRLSPDSEIILHAIFPRSPDAQAPWRKKLMEVNQRIKPLGARDKVTFLDIGEVFLLEGGAMNRNLMPDLLHPNRAGYQAWADALRPVLAEHLDLPAQP